MLSVMWNLQSFLNHLMESLYPHSSLLLLPLESIFSSCSSPAQELFSSLLTSYYYPKLPVPKHLQAFDIFILTRLLYLFFTQTDASQIAVRLGWSLGDLGSILAWLCQASHLLGFLLLYLLFVTYKWAHSLSHHYWLS